MYLLGKRADTIEAEDIKRLIESKTQESKILDYKKELNISKDADKKEFLFDISAMFNTDGGCIIFGIEEQKDENQQNTGIPSAVVGLGNLNFDKTTQLIEDIIRGNTEPSITQIIVKPLEIDGSSILIVGIPKCIGLPAMVTFNVSNKFYKRRNSGKYPVDVYELNQMFMQSQVLKDKIIAFRKERIQTVLGGEFLPSLEIANALFVHIVPFNFLDYSITDFSKAANELMTKMRPIGNGGWDKMYNIDGFAGYATSGDRTKITAYNQLYRNGIYESYSTDLFYQTRSGAIGFDPISFMGETLEVIENGLYVLNQFNIDSPFYVSFSFHNVMNKVVDNSRSYYIQKFRNNDVVLPFVLIPEYKTDIKKALKANFDILYQSVGFASSPEI